MAEWIVTRAVRVQADTREEAVQASAGMEPDSVRVCEGLPPERHGYRRYYHQETDVLDAAWDLYMDATLPVEMSGAPMRLPSLLELGGNPQQLSLLFDCAITGYRERFEG